MANRLRREESGSMLLTMLAIITIGAMITATFSMVRQSQQTTRRDRAWVDSIQIADAGVQQALTYLSTTEVPAATTTITASALGLDTTTENGSFDWTATRNGFSWQVVANGTVQDVTRRVEAVVERPARFFLAAFGDRFVTLNGGNIVDSYNSSTCGALSPCPTTGNGAVGSNGQITLRGSTDVDGVFLYGPGAACDGNECTADDTEGGGASAPIVMQDVWDVAYAESLEADACPNGATDNLFRSSTSGPLVGGNTYCFDGMVFDTDSEVLSGATPENPVTVYIFHDGLVGDLQFQEVNIPASGAPEPGSLIINVLGGDVELRNHAKYAFAVLAPLSECRKNGSNAQTEIFGSMICGSMANVGGWSFHFDDALLESGIGLFDITAWREEYRSGTSFD